MLIALIALLAVGGLYFFLSNLSPEFLRANIQQKTDRSLSQAREALIGYALQYRERQILTGTNDAMYGFLPMPDVGTASMHPTQQNPACKAEGCSMDFINGAFPADKQTVIGRFPWRTLGLEALRDGHGECLWYAVSANFKSLGMDPSLPMNWDALGQMEIVIANGSATDLISALANKPHDRPLAIIFSPGPPLPGQDRSASATDDVGQCGGNYNPANYLDPSIAAVQGGLSAYFAGPRGVDTSVTPMALAIQGGVEKDAGNVLHATCPQGSNCSTIANDRGLPLTSGDLFGALRKSSSFRTDLNSMLDRMTGCLRDEIVAAGGSLATPYAKIAGADGNPCYGQATDPRGYYPHYKEMVYVAAPGAVTATVDGAAQSCAGALLFAGQRDATTLRCPTLAPTEAQRRSSGAEKLDPCNYLEGPNLASFTSSGTAFSGPRLFAQVSGSHPAHTDIVRCIPAGASMVAAPSALPPGAELARYDPATRILTLGRQDIESDLGYAANTLFGCAWTPEVHATGSGFRSYFKFNILDSGDGFTFAAIDGDQNTTTDVCGAGEQHLGYSGYNGFTPSIAYPKLGLEFDTRRNFQTNLLFTPTGFNPARTTFTAPTQFRTLANGRADPSYAGGHIGLVYWGGETPINTLRACGAASSPCLFPSYCDTDNFCKLKQEEDDNVHGQLPTPPATRPPPHNEAAPVTPPDDPPYPPYAVDKLDPSLSSVPTNIDIHVRVEVARRYAGRDDNSRLVKAVAATSLATLSGLPVVDSVPLQPGDAVLVTAQTDARDNGVYAAGIGAWVRSGSADEPGELAPGTSWFIKQGTIHRGSLWRVQNEEPPTLGSSNINIARVRSAVQAVATTDLALAGLPTVAGVALAAGDRVLLTGQTDATQNGVYLASAGAWVRAAPEDTAAGLRDGATWFATSGAGSYWRLSGDATPGTSPIAIAPLSFPSNDVYYATITTQVWKLADSVTVANQIVRMQTTTRSMNQLDPVVRHAQCLPGNTCPASNPDGQTCGGVETDGFRYCYTGQKPKLYDSKKIFDIRGTTSCNISASCTGNQFCGIDNVCYQPALRATRLGFTGSQSTNDQEINISDFFTTWLP